MLLLRHASAGEPISPSWLDRERALDRIGRLQSSYLQQSLAGFAIERIVTSPHTRCVQTVRPFALALGLELECHDALGPDGSGSNALALLDELPGESLICTHREVIERLFNGEVQCEKGGTWVLERANDCWRPVIYRPAAAVEGIRGRAAVV